MTLLFRFCIFATTIAATAAIGMLLAQAQVPLSAYADKDGYVDVQKLTCAQLAGTFQKTPIF